jgi:hypothetical protein
MVRLDVAKIVMVTILGHLCECIVSGCYMSKFSIWILKDYGTNKWILKHTVSIRRCLQRLRFNLVTWVWSQATQWL